MAWLAPCKSEIVSDFPPTGKILRLFYWRPRFHRNGNNLLIAGGDFVAAYVLSSWCMACLMAGAICTRMECTGQRALAICSLPRGLKPAGAQAPGLAGMRVRETGTGSAVRVSVRFPREEDDAGIFNGWEINKGTVPRPRFKFSDAIRFNRVRGSGSRVRCVRKIRQGELRFNKMKMINGIQVWLDG
jgi:hypothetical protein